MSDKAQREGGPRDLSKDETGLSPQTDGDLNDTELEKVSGGIGFLRDGSNIVLNEKDGEAVTGEAAFRV